MSADLFGTRSPPRISVMADPDRDKQIFETNSWSFFQKVEEDS